MSEQVQSWGNPSTGKDTFPKKLRIKSTKPGEPDSVLIVRLLPPIKKQAARGTGTWAVYIGQHFGYQVPSTRGGKPYHVPFRCIQESDWRTKMVTRRCGECENIDQVKCTLETKRAECKSKKMGEKETDELLKSLSNWLREHNCDRKWHMCVMTQEGDFHYLLMNHRDEKKLLDLKIEQFQSDFGFHPLDPERGVWLKITCSGERLQRKVDMTWVSENTKDPITGKWTSQFKNAPLTQEHCQKATKVLDDLEDSVRSISSDQIDALVACTGDPEDVERIMGISQTASRQEMPESSDFKAPPPANLPIPEEASAAPPQVPPETPQVSSGAPPVAPPAPVADVEEDEEVALLAALAAARAKKAVKAVAAGWSVTPPNEVIGPPAPAVAPAPEVNRQALSEMSEADFLARFKK